MHLDEDACDALGMSASRADNKLGIKNLTLCAEHWQQPNIFFVHTQIRSAFYLHLDVFPSLEAAMLAPPAK